MIQKLWKRLLYGGVEKEEFDQLQALIREKNRELLRICSLMGTIGFFLLLIVSAFSNGFVSVNSTTYLLCGTGMLLLLICSLYVLPEHPLLTTAFVYLFQIILYVFGVHISLLHAEKAAVSAVAFLLVGPLLFYDRPLRQTALTAAVVAVFCEIVYRYKAPDVAESDIWNMITFGIVAIATTVFMMSIKIRELLQSRQIEYMSQTDLLTGVRNRNHYENRLLSYPRMCSTNLICVFADVNGLHEVNNREGHLAGDRMLCEVAAVLRKHFDSDHIYRVGGDEFVAFQADGQPDRLPAAIRQMEQELERKGYHVSFGTAVYPKRQGIMDMHEIVNDAESSMLARKQEFYSRFENDRRSR